MPARCALPGGVATVVAGTVLAGIPLGLLGGCSHSTPAGPGHVAAPRLGACFQLTPAQTQQPSNESPPVPCTGSHTAQTFAIGTLPASTGTTYADPRHGAWVYHHCQAAFGRFVGADSSLVLRIQLSWVWFRPPRADWSRGAHWFRCDVVGGPAQATAYAALPTTVKGLFQALPSNVWLTCAEGANVATAARVSCAARHDWRAVTTVVVGAAHAPYPGNRLVQVTSRDYCSNSVDAWLHYPPTYAFGYTWFRQAQWRVGNRRSICWARTNR